MKSTLAPSHTTRLIVVVAYDGCQSLDITGPWEVFCKANTFFERHRAQPGKAAYRLVLASPMGGSVTTNSGLEIANTQALASLRGSIDTILVVGGNEQAMEQPPQTQILIPWLKRKAPHVRRMGSVCTGAFALAATGLLNGRRATTHWVACERMAAMHPKVLIQPDAIYVADPPFYTSAGITAGIDLTLALVEADLGQATALDVARDLVLFLRRSGGQSQFSTGLKAQKQASHRFQDLLVWMMDHPRADLSLQALAERVSMSERNFSRVFKQETNMTPAKFVEALRVESAKAHIEQTQWRFERVAQQAGFGSVDSLQRSMQRHASVTPEQYRQRFA
ncbi:MAG: GlxA family transcriptional regulator [Pseudomonadota bacterium]